MRRISSNVAGVLPKRKQAAVNDDDSTDPEKDENCKTATPSVLPANVMMHSHKPPLNPIESSTFPTKS
jgi:hypothetical protein